MSLTNIQRSAMIGLRRTHADRSHHHSHSGAEGDRRGPTVAIVPGMERVEDTGGGRNATVLRTGVGGRQCVHRHREAGSASTRIATESRAAGQRVAAGSGTTTGEERGPRLSSVVATPVAEEAAKRATQSLLVAPAAVTALIGACVVAAAAEAEAKAEVAPPVLLVVSMTAVAPLAAVAAAGNGLQAVAAAVVSCQSREAAAGGGSVVEGGCPPR
mmetsp:Transcript_83739/g.211147  ORF Transcript_83739/g.211147 Transcript_83739/m.211147 type:complete len:215 (+) Transcript_83739:676-1320(+)